VRPVGEQGRRLNMQFPNCDSTWKHVERRVASGPNCSLCGRIRQICRIACRRLVFNTHAPWALIQSLPLA
jgi:hypothetical protein